MRRLAVSIVLTLLVLLPAAAGQGEPTLNVGRISAPLAASLPRWGTFYVEVVYNADRPLRLQAQGYAGGQPLERGEAMNASVLHPAGDGKALVWVSYSEPALIDEVRVTAYDGNWNPLAAVPVAVRLQWLSAAATSPQARPAWVTELAETEMRTAVQMPADPGSAAGRVLTALIGLFMFVAVPGYFVIQAAALIVLEGRWRLAALTPLAIMVPAVAHASYAFAYQSNLWPIMVILAAPFCFLYLAGPMGLRWMRQPLGAG